MAENYFNGVKPLDDGLALMLLDTDDFLPSSSHYIAVPVNLAKLYI